MAEVIETPKDEKSKEIAQPGSNEDIKDNKNDADDEKKEEKKVKNSGLLDVAFVLDCTGSMSAYIQSCKDNILSISNKISEEVKDCNVQFALVLYRDIPPQDKTFITKKLDFTPIPFKIKIELEGVSANGGGDHPECLTSALYDCKNNLTWRKDAIKVIIVITDAPPHGIETKGSDGFPDGDPDTFGQNDLEGDTVSGKIDRKKTLNLIEIVQSIRDELKAAIYSVACEPDLSCNSDFAQDFMRYMSEYTKGRFLPLSSAKLLPEVIVGSVKQQINIKNLKNNLDEVIKEIKAEHGDDISGDKLNKIIMQKWKEAGVKKKEISIGTLYRKERSRENIELLMNGQKIKSLKDFKAQAKNLGRLKRSDFRHLDKGKKNPYKGVKPTYYSDDDDSDFGDESDEDDSDEDDGDDCDDEKGSLPPKMMVKKKKKKKKGKTGPAKKLRSAVIALETKEEEEEEEECDSSSAAAVNTFGGDDSDDDSDSDESQAYYSESCSLNEDDIADMLSD